MIISKAYSYEDYFEQSAGEGANSELIQVFEYYRENPLNLESVSANRLTVLPFINPHIAEKLINLRNASKYKSIKEIIKAANLDNRSKYIIENCVSYGETSGFASDFRMRSIDRFQKVEGFRDSVFVGSPIDFFTRGRISYKNFEVNFAQNKNAGEEKFDQTLRYSLGYFTPKTRLAVGDIKIKRGLGLSLSNGFALRKNPQSTSGFNNYGEGVLPSRSIFDFARFFGVATQHKFSIRNFNIEPLLYYFDTPRPATLKDKGYVSSLYQTGLYRTENEIEKIDILQEKIFGGGLELSYIDNVIIGFNSYTYEYNRDVETKSFRYFNGSEGDIHSAYLFINRNWFHLSSELAYDASDNIGFIANSSFNLKDIEFLFSYRYLEPYLRLQYSNIITESSVNSNEEGLYIGMEYKKDAIVNNLYLDHFKSIRPFDEYFIESGYEIMDDAIYKIKNGYFNFRFRYESKSFLENNEDKTNYFFTNRSRTSVRFELNKSLKYKIDARLRVEYAHIDFQGDLPEENGIQSFVEIKKEILDGFRSGIRYTFYDTDSFESSIWHFEFLVPGFMISPPLYLQGNKILAYLNYKFSDFSIWLRYTRDRRASEFSLGSGYDEISGNIDERLYFQIDFRFR